MDCERCGEPNACFGIGPPAQAEQGWYCSRCASLTPARQAALAREASEALDDREILAA